MEERLELIYKNILLEHILFSRNKHPGNVDLDKDFS